MFELKKILAEIQESFTGVSIPKIIAANKSGPGYEEIEDLEKIQLPKSWADLPQDLILYHAWDLPLLSSEAYYYFLPAFLTQGLIAMENVDDPLLEATLMSLQRTERIALISGKQKKVLRTVFDLIEKKMDGAPLADMARQCKKLFGN